MIEQHQGLKSGTDSIQYLQGTWRQFCTTELPISDSSLVALNQQFPQVEHRSSMRIHQHASSSFLNPVSSRTVLMRRSSIKMDSLIGLQMPSLLASKISSRQMQTGSLLSSVSASDTNTKPPIRTIEERHVSLAIGKLTTQKL